jgi:hypothetical protein
LFLPEEGFINKTGRLQGHFQKTSKSVCTSTIVVFPDHLSPTPSTYAALKTPENTDGEPDDPQPTEISEWNTHVISCTAKVQEQ